MIDINDVTILPSNERTFPQTLNSIVRHVIYNLKGYTCLLLLYFKLANKTQWLKNVSLIIPIHYMIIQIFSKRFYVDILRTNYKN